VARAVAATSRAISRAQRQRFDKAGGVRVDIGEIERPRIREISQQTAKQRGIHARRDRQEQVGALSRSRCAADRSRRICTALLFGFGMIR
jgi:hypothetical protein